MAPDFPSVLCFSVHQVRVSPYCILHAPGRGQASPCKGSLCSNPHPFGARLQLRSACGFRVGPCSPSYAAHALSSTDTHPKYRSNKTDLLRKKEGGE